MTQTLNFEQKSIPPIGATFEQATDAATINIVDGVKALDTRILAEWGCPIHSSGHARHTSITIGE